MKPACVEKLEAENELKIQKNKGREDRKWKKWSK